MKQIRFTNPELEAYRVATENLASYKDSKPFENTGPEHSAIVMSNIFRTAEFNVNIFCGNFNGDISNNAYYLEGLEIYLAKKKPLNIIFENKPNPYSKASLLIHTKMHDAVSMYELTETLPESENKAKFNHFCVADKRMFRVEMVDSYNGVGSFNEPTVAASLENRFAFLLTKSSEFVRV